MQKHGLFSHIRPLRLAVFTLFYLMMLFSTSLQPALAASIEDIIVKGNQRIEPATIISYLSTQKGDPINADTINTSLKNLYATGLFADVSIAQDKRNLVVSVVENPVINKVVFEGNKRIDDETLSKELTLKPRIVFTESKLKSDMSRVKNLYKKNGRFSVYIEPKIIELDQNRVNLVFEIDEGSKATIRKIRFIGNHFFSSKALKEILHSEESRWYKFFSANDTYDPDRLAFDKELLRKFYLSKGFADFSVVSSVAEITPDKEHFIITFSISEGERYTFGDIAIDSRIPEIKSDDLQEAIITEQNEIFNADQVSRTVEGITDIFNEKGYAFAEVNTRYDRHETERTMDVKYVISEGPKVYVERINITGNVRTLDKVIRREFRVAEGDPFNAERIKRSRERIQNLGFFDKVNIDNKAGSTPDKTIVDVDVSERSTGELNFGAGFSTTEGALGNVSIRERNLLGRGQSLRLGYQQSSRSSQINLGFTEPYFLDKDLEAGFDIYSVVRDQSNESSFDSDTKGFTLRAGYSLTEYLRHNFYYSLVSTDINNVQSDASLFVREQAGSNLTSAIGHTLLYDRRDNKFDPKEGYFAQINEEIAGVGGDSKYIKHEAKAAYYYPLFDRQVVLSLRGKAGNIFGYSGKDVRINERFFIGGTTIRGFKNAGIGPRDTQTTDALGGQTYYATTIEAVFPLGLPEELDFKGALFVDAGSLFDIDGDTTGIRDENSIRASVGAGIAWTSPLGPIRLDIAHAFAKESYDKTRNIQFNFGTRF